LTRQLPNSMQQSPPSQTKNFSVSEDIPRILYNPTFITFLTTARQFSLSWT